MAPLAPFSFAALDEAERLVGSLQSWPIEIVGDDGSVAPLVLVGPIAVRPDRQRDGLGRRLTGHALAALDAADETASMLVGDPEYYGRFFGFDAAPAAGWRLPGPVEQRRVLARVPPGVRLPAAGILRPRRA